MAKIKAVIADVDGVMVGKEAGVNFPLPHTDVIGVLRQIAHRGTPIVLCTAKFRAAIDGIITGAQLDNPHISDGGALIINPLGKPLILEQHFIDKTTVLDYLSTNHGYTELYTAQTVYIEKQFVGSFSRSRSQLLQTNPVIVNSLRDIAETMKIIKIISFANNVSDKPRIEAQAERLDSKVHYIWSHHPWTLPRVPCIITAPGITKAQAARKVAAHLGIPFEAILGIGDSPADWNFMELCSYAGTVGDNRELRKLAKLKGPGRYFHASSVDDHGLLDIFKYFGLL